MRSTRYEPIQERILSAALPEPPCSRKRGKYDWLAVDVCATAVAKRQPPLLSSAEVVALLNTAASMEARATEHVVAIYVNAQMQPLAASTLHKGGFAWSAVDNAAIFQLGLLVGASGFFIAHNHPGGSLRPSPDDDRFTKKLQDGAPLVGLRLFDHIIVAGLPESGQAKYFSYQDTGRFINL
jgi:DNA repair protein RadC